MTDLINVLPESALSELASAFDALEHPSFAARLSNALGMPIEAGLRLLSPALQAGIRVAAHSAMTRALQLIVTTLPADAVPPSRKRLHAGLCIGAGAVGGFFGLPGLLLELPLTTGVILRSIAAIAQSHGEHLEHVQTQFACLEVFALGGPSTDDDAAGTGYYGMRFAMAAHFATLSTLLGRSASEAALPSSVVAIRALATRFGVVISDKVAAQLVPILGAAAGAVVNGLFIRHFQSIAGGHFTIRRLERQHGSELVRAAYESLRFAATTLPRDRWGRIQSDVHSASA